MAPTPPIYLKPDDGLRDRIKARAAAEGLSIGDWLQRAVTSALDGAAVPLTLSAAAQILLQHLDRDQAELIVDCCADTGLQPEDYLLAYCRLIHERGETPTVSGDRQLLDPDAPRPVHPTIGTQRVCAYAACQRSFTVTKRGQKFCPDPDDGTESCGRRAHLAELHAQRPALRDNRYAPATKPVAELLAHAAALPAAD